MQKRTLQFSLFLVSIIFVTACAVNENGQMVIQLIPMEAEAQQAEAPAEEANDEGDFQPTFATVEVADGLYSFGNGEVFGAFMVTDEGVIVMDSVNPMFASLMQAAIKGVTDQPVRYLIYSHNHWDHIGGGQLFKDAGAIVLAHHDIYDWLANHPAPSPDVVIPDLTWNGARHDIVLGGKTVELHHFGPSHGEGMTVFRFPAENAIFTVDLVVPKRVGFAYMPDFTPRGWIATLYAIEELEYETVMFSHNAAFGPRSAVTEQREFLEDLQNEIVTRMQAGENPSEIVETIELPKYQDWAGYDAWLSMNAWRIMLEMFMGH